MTPRSTRRNVRIWLKANARCLRAGLGYVTWREVTSA